MKILLIEDLESKAAAICRVVGDNEITQVAFLKAAIKQLNDKSFDLILLDMRFPIYNDSSHTHYLGIDILLELESLGLGVPCIIITSDSEIDFGKESYRVKDATKALKNEIDCNLLGCLTYDSFTSKWADQLSQLISMVNTSPISL